MTWILFAIATPGLYAVANVGGGILSQRYLRSPVGFVGVLAAVTPIIVLAITALDGISVSSARNALILLLAGAGIPAFEILYFRSLMLEEVSAVIPLLQLYPVIVLLLSLTLLHQPLTPRAIAAFGLVIGGSAILSVDLGAGRHLLRIRAGAMYMIGAALVFACMTILIRIGAASMDAWKAVAYQYAGSGLCVLSLLVLVRPFRRTVAAEGRHLPRAAVPLIAVDSACTLGAYYTYTRAIVSGPVPIVSALQGLQPAFVLLFGVVFSLWLPHILREDISPRNLLRKGGALALIALGIVVTQG